MQIARTVEKVAVARAEGSRQQAGGTSRIQGKVLLLYFSNFYFEEMDSKEIAYVICKVNISHLTYTGTMHLNPVFPGRNASYNSSTASQYRIREWTLPGTSTRS